MHRSIRSHLLASVTGGLLVVAVLLGFGLIGKRTTQPVVYETLEEGAPVLGHGGGLSMRDIYLDDAPAVVFVTATRSGPVANPLEGELSAHQTGGATAEHGETVSTGSGFLISSGGLVLTCYHLIAGADPSTGITVQFDYDSPRAAIVVGANESDDLALLRVSTAGLTGVRPLPLGDSASVKGGDPTLALADPFGLARTLASGIVSALQPEIVGQDGFAVDNVIETDAPSLPGDSGGPLLDAAGRVIGVNSQILAAGEDGAGDEVGFAVPVDTVVQFLQAAGISAPA